MTIPALQRILATRFPDAVPLPRGVVRPVPTGVQELDRILPHGGLPRGKLTAWAAQGIATDGVESGGAMALLRSAARTTIAAGERVAWIHGAGTIGPWGAHAEEESPLLLRPTGRLDALRSAETLLRSGGFALVVLTGVRPEGTEAVRLTRAVRESGGEGGGSAFVVLTPALSLASLRLTSRLLPDRYTWRDGPFGEPALPEAAMIEVRAQALGWSERTTIVLPITLHALRLSLDPELVDRRGCSR
jgi:hypothetical protein